MVKVAGKMLGNPEKYIRKAQGTICVMPSMPPKLKMSSVRNHHFNSKNELKKINCYLDNIEWLDNLTGGEYQRYYQDMYTNKLIMRISI
mgnify:CR=1 FL=1